MIPITLCVPLLVDGLSGAWFSLDDEVRVKLDRLPPPLPSTIPVPTPLTYSSR